MWFFFTMTTLGRHPSEKIQFLQGGGGLAESENQCVHHAHIGNGKQLILPFVHSNYFALPTVKYQYWPCVRTRQADNAYPAYSLAQVAIQSTQNLSYESIQCVFFTGAFPVCVDAQLLYCNSSVSTWMFKIGSTRWLSWEIYAWSDRIYFVFIAANLLL